MNFVGNGPNLTTSDPKSHLHRGLIERLATISPSPRRQTCPISVLLTPGHTLVRFRLKMELDLDLLERWLMMAQCP